MFKGQKVNNFAVLKTKTYSSLTTTAEDFTAAFAAHRATLATRDEDIFLVVVKPVEVGVIKLFVQIDLDFLLGFFVVFVVDCSCLDEEEDEFLIAIVVERKDV
uniref:Uncharacterized protein n=1 Tax=Panagrolaimus sp. ES5 TaxID=591445 RepID=A0AC34GNT1_9BILA